jgi:hypothetical protein
MIQVRNIGSLAMEKWKQILGWPNYEISNLGNVRGRHGVIETFIVKGYVSFNVSGGTNKRKSLRVHREVLRAFTGDSPGLCACHNDGNPLNCNLDNLRWDTHRGNEKDKKKHGTYLDGESHHQCKLTKEQVVFIKHSLEKGIVLAKRFGVSDSNICEIRHGRSWKCLS